MCRLLVNAAQVGLVRSDHGHGFFTDFVVHPDEWTDESIKARTGMLWSARLPEQCQQYFYPHVSPVNTFKIVFSCLHGEKQEFLPGRIYIHDEGNKDFKLLTPTVSGDA